MRAMIYSGALRVLEYQPISLPNDNQRSFRGIVVPKNVSGN